MLGAVSNNEYKTLVGHLGGLRRNHVFHFFAITAPRRAAEAKIIAGGDAVTTGVLEMTKRKCGACGPAAKKQARLIDDVLGASPL